MKKLITLLVIITMTLSTNAQSWWGKRVEGNGKVTTETRKTGSYDGVSLGGFFNINLVKGKEGKITLEGEENLLPYIKTEVKGGTLTVSVKKGVNIRTSRKLNVTIPVKEISKVALGGSGNINSDFTLQTENLKISLGGSGNINLKVDAQTISSSIGGSGNISISGKADHVKCSIAGSGNIKAYKLKTNSIKAKIAGSGDIRVSVEDEIHATLAGSGSIYYKGNPPKIHSKSVGSGKIVSRN